MRLLAWLLITFIALHTLDVSAKNRDRVARDFRHADVNEDGKLSLSEWKRRGNFSRLDANEDGFISLPELRLMYQGHDRRNYSWPPSSEMQANVEVDPSVMHDRIGADEIDKQSVCGITWRRDECSIENQVQRGPSATGTGPDFPDNAICPGIDDFWAMDYSHKRNFKLFHGGIDIPVPWGTPIRAVSDGAIIAIFDADMSKRGIEVVLRHSPEDTGLPFWSYSAYGHLDRKPELKIGQLVQKSQALGPTGNSGISGRGGGQSRNRRPALHFATFYSDFPQYGLVDNVVVPKNGYWLDPLVFFHGKPPFDTPSIKALPESKKSMSVSVMYLYEDAPGSTQRIWPYAYSRR